MISGFSVFTGRKDIFVELDSNRRDDRTVIEFLNRYQNHINNFACIDKTVIDWTKKHMVKASYELITTANGFKYHKVVTKDGITCTPVNDESAIIILK